MTESLSTGAALTLPTPPLPPSRTDEKRTDAASPAAGTTQKAARWLQERSSSKKPLTIALQRQRTRSDIPHSDIPHSSGNRTSSDRNPRSGSNKASNISSNKGTDVFFSEAMLRAKGKAAAGALEVEDISVRDVTPFSTRSAPTPQLYAANNKQQIGSQSSTTSTAARKTTHPAKPAALLSPAVGSGPTSLPQPGGAGLLSSSKRGLSPGVSSETVKQSLLGSLLMPDGVTVRKPPPLGISSGDPIGTHILRRRATSMRTEKFSSSGLNLSLHRHAAANNSMLSWQRSFQSGPRGAASFSSPSSAYGSSYNRRARGNSFMGRPIETLPRLVAFSPSLSKALQQQAHLIPAPPVIDSAYAGPAAADAVSLSTAGASSVVPTIVTSRPPGAASSSPNAATVFPGNVALSLAGTRARDKVPQDIGEKATAAASATGPSRDQVTTAAIATTTTAAAVFKEEAAGKIGDTTASHVEIVGELEGPKVLQDDETVTASYCTTKTPGRVCYSSSVNSSSSTFEVRRRVGEGADERFRKTGQANCSALQHPTDILSHTTFDHSHSDSSSSSSEGSSTRSSRGDRTSTKASSSSRSASCWPTAHENVTDVPSEVRTSLAASPNDVVVAGTSGAPATSSAGSGIFPSDSSFTQMIEVTTSVSVRPPVEAASSPPSSVEAEHLQEKTGGPQSERPILSPALLYQLGITKFTEGRAPEAIEAITRFLRDAAAKKRRQQRQTAESSSSTCPTQPRAGEVVTVHILKERHDEKEDAAISSPPAGGDPCMTATNALAKEKQQGDEKSEKLAVCGALIDGDIAGEEETESKVSKVQDVNPSISCGPPLSWSSSRTDATAVSSGKSVALVETSVTATKGHDGDACGHLACEASSFKDVGVLTGACEETQQQEREQEAHLQLQGGKEPARGKASDKDDGTRKETNVREGATVKLKAQQVSAVQLHGDATAAETTRSHAHPQGSRQDFQGRTIREGFTAEKDIDAGVDSSHSPKPFALPGTTQSAAADAAAPDTTAGDATATDPTAAHAASPDTTAAEATAAGATAAGATAAGATADDATAADAAAADATGADAAAAHTTAVDADVFNLQKAAVQGNEEAKGGADGETGRTEGHQDDVGAFDELEAVPVQKLFGVVYGRRMQIDRRAKDLIAGWGTPQYFHLEKLLGHLLFEEGDFAEAVRHYWRCIDLRPDDSQLYTNLGLAYYEMGATEEAMASFEQALKCNDRNPVALSVLAMLLMDKFEDAEELSHQEAENAEQEELTPAHETARLERLLKGTDRCVTLLKRCVEVEEDNVLAVLHLAQVYMYREEWDKAEAIFRALLQENADDTHLLNNLGQIAMNKGDTRQALQLFERALQINPQDELAHMHMCEAFCSLQHLGRALQHFRLCCEASPDSVSLHATCGLPLCEAGKEKEVVAAYTKFIKQYPESVAAKTFKRSLGSSNDQVGFLESSQIIVFIVLPILLLMVFLIGFTQLISYWSSPTDDRSLPASWESIYYTSPPDSSS